MPGCWMPDAGCRMKDEECGTEDSGFLILDAIAYARFKVPDARCTEGTDEMP